MNDLFLYHHAKSLLIFHPLLFTGIERRLDVVVASDSSINVDRDHFAKLQKFLKGIINAYDLSSEKTRVGLMTFGYEQRRDLRIEDGIYKAVLQQAIYDMKPVGGERNLAAALKFAEENMFDEARDVGRILILLTTSQASGRKRDDELKANLNTLMKQSINLVTLAFGEEKGDEELRMIKENNTVVNVVDSLKSLVPTVMEESGKAAGKLVETYC